MKPLSSDAFAQQVAEVLGFDAVPDRDTPLLELGLDSLMATELRTWAKKVLGVSVELKEFLGGASISHLEELLVPPDARAAVPVSGDEREIAAGEAPGAVQARAGDQPLSYGQQALWFIHQDQPESAAYNVGIGLRIQSALVVDDLRAAFQAVLDRHPSLRATFPIVNGEPVQRVGVDVRVDFEFSDESSLDTTALRAHVTGAYRRPFDLATGPLVRVRVYGRAENDFVLLLTLHHIVCDAQSCWTILEEVQALYGAIQSGTPASRRSAPGVGYADFVDWQRQMLGGPEGDRLWAYWRRALSGELPALALPTDFVRPTLASGDGASHLVTIPLDLTRDLRRLAQEAGATLYATLLAAFHVLLYRYTGQDDVLVGSAALGRPADFEGVVGYFVNPVTSRADLSGDPSFLSLLGRIRQATFDALDHQHFPFPLLVERLRPKRDSGRSPVFQADFALSKSATTYRRGLGADHGLVFERFPLPEAEGQFDLSLHVTDEEDQLEAALRYRTDLFTPETIARMGATLVTLLESIVRDPHGPISRLAILAPVERDRTIGLGQGPRIDYPALAVHRMFERQVARTPDAVAVECVAVADATGGGDHVRTYREVNQRANQLARYLRDRGVGRESLVGVCIDASFDLVTGILAVLKAGGAYVPLDADYPASRLSFMMADAAAPVLLTTKRHSTRVPTETTTTTVCVDVERDAIAQQDDTNLEGDMSPGQLAYVIYTSGSTGVPKGAAITHGGLSNYLSWCLEAYDVKGGSGAPVSSSIGFDATVTSFFAPLLAGGRIVLLPEAHTLETLRDVLASGRRFSLVKITPAHLEALSDLLPPEAYRDSARALVIGGEALRGDRLSTWQACAPDTRLVNEYGPTETVVGCSVYEVHGPSVGNVPIGRPIANTQIYVLDRHREIVPQGVVGELYVGGAGVARGYHARPDLTTAHFVPDSFSGRPDARLYRTGDFGRLLSDGSLECLGRADHQIKIRGFRIEPGEIESVMARRADIAECLVATWDPSTGQRALVAYVVSSGPALSVADVRQYLSEQLPAHMVPSFIVVMDALPLTAHGKVDRARLPAPESSAAGAGRLAPRDPLELRLVALWEDVLGLAPVGIRDNFFDLGGHSLLAVRLMACLEREFKRTVPLSAILRGPTVEQLAHLLRSETTAGAPSLVVPIQTAGRNRPFYCVPGAGGNVIYLHSLAQHLGPDQPFFGLQGVGFDGEAPPQTTVESMASRYLQDVLAIQPQGPFVLGGHSLGGWVAFEMAQQLQRRGEEVSMVAIIDTPVPDLLQNRDTSGWDSARWITELADRVARLLNPNLRVSSEDLRQLSEDQQLKYFKDSLAGLNLFPQEAGTEHLRNVLKLFKAHATVRYRIPDDALPTRIALFRTAAPSLEADRLANDPTWGWGAYGAVEVRTVPGDHLAVLRPPHVAALAEALSACLAHPDAVFARA